MKTPIICRRVPALAAATLVAALAAGCGSSSSSSSSSATSSPAGASSTASASGTASSGKHVNVAFLNESITSYTIPMTDAMQQAAAADNASVKMFNANNDPSTQNSQCQTAISSGTYQAIVMYPVDGAAAVACATQAMAAHIQFVPVDSPVGKDPTSTAIQVPGIKAQVLGSALNVDVAGTVQLVKMACAHFPPPCTIVQTEAIPAFFYSTYKVQHEQPQFKALGYKILATPVIGNFDDPDGTKSAITTILAKDPNIDVIVSDDDSSVQGAVQLKKDGQLPKTLIVGDGGSSIALKSIDQGYEYATTFNVPRSESEEAVREAADLVRGDPVPPPVTKTQLNLAKHYLITKANVNDVTAEW